jgi:hypothetical protein
LAPASGKTERVAPDKGAAQTGKQPDVTAEKSVPKPPAPAPAIAQKAASQALPPTKGVPEVAVPRTQQPEADGHARSTANEKVPQTPPNLEDIFDFKKNLIGLFVAAVFGLAPGLLFDRLQQQADRYKADLKSSKSTEEARKT